MIKNKVRKRSSVHQKNNVLSTIRLSSGVHNFDRSLQIFFGKKAPNSLCLRGNPAILDREKLAFFCSKKCPGEIITATYDIMKNIRNQGIMVISGFHSPMEQECLDVLLKGKQPIIMCPARSIDNMRLKPELKRALDNEQLLIISPFSGSKSRISAQNAMERNRLVMALADYVLILYAALKSKTLNLCRLAIECNKPLFTLKSKYNTNLIDLGANTIDAASVNRKDPFGD
jgi:predicted Rossmann fold nucleotide-binding protein DprA/Smf involved in DNA uptake